MAFTEVERSICNKMSFDSSGLLNPAEAIKGSIRNQISSVRSKLSSYVPSSQATLDSSSATLQTNVGTIIPNDGDDDVQAMIDLINNCDYLKDDDALKNPVSLGKTMEKSLFDKISDYIGDLIVVPEYDIGKALSSIEEIYGSLFPSASGITDLMKNADKLINCLSNLCNGEYATEIVALTNQTTNLYSDFQMVSNPLDANYGLLDKNQLYSDAGLTVSDITKISGVNDEIDTIKSNAKQSIQNLMDKTKSLRKAGDIIF